MIVVFIHQNFPAQYVHIARRLAEVPHNRVYFITQAAQLQLPRVIKLIYKPEAAGAAQVHPYVGAFDQAVRSGAAVAAVCRRLKADGIVPDLLVGHAGWGETLFVKDVFPEIPLLANFEFFYHARGADVGFDPEFAPAREDVQDHVRGMNALGQRLGACGGDGR